MHISEMQKLAWQNSEDHGFHLDKVDFATRLMLIVSELAEAMEDHRKGIPVNYDGVEIGTDKPVGVPSELADVIIRVGDLAGVYGIDLESAVIRKMEYNKSRPFKHGKQY